MRSSHREYAAELRIWPPMLTADGSQKSIGETVGAQTARTTPTQREKMDEETRHRTAPDTRTETSPEE